MKALKLIIGFLAFSIMMAIAPVRAQDVKFSTDDTYRSCTTIQATDTVNTNTEKGKIFLVDKPLAYTYILTAKATRTSTAKACQFILYGSINGVDYFAIGNPIAWKQATADTTVVFNSSTTTVNWRFLKCTLKAAASGARARLGNQYLKIGL
ncbi:MAG TPA: hypothetical protein VK172_14755 [Lentimicrobium sp.]|nr:hypothetical protein [Bacteroidales bacterium]HLO92422.1 hypothetical protein [Lentimicrobium sp.]